MSVGDGRSAFICLQLQVTGRCRLHKCLCCLKLFDPCLNVSLSLEILTIRRASSAQHQYPRQILSSSATMPAILRSDIAKGFGSAAGRTARHIASRKPSIQHTASILNIPLEIRTLVYKILFEGIELQVFRRARPTLLDKTGFDRAMKSVCRQINQECRPWFLHSCSLRLHIPQWWNSSQDLRTFSRWQRPPVSVMECVRKITVDNDSKNGDLGIGELIHLAPQLRCLDIGDVRVYRDEDVFQMSSAATNQVRFWKNGVAPPRQSTFDESLMLDSLARRGLIDGRLMWTDWSIQYFDWFHHLLEYRPEVEVMATATAVICEYPKRVVVVSQFSHDSQSC